MAEQDQQLDQINDVDSETVLGLGLLGSEEGESPSTVAQCGSDGTVLVKQSLGFASRFTSPTDIGKSVEQDVANSLNYLITTKVEDKQFTETCDKYCKPENCVHLLVTKVNPLFGITQEPG